MLARHQELVRDAFGSHRGDEIDTQGDAFFVAFHSAADAVAAAIAMQRALAGEPWPEGCAVRVRIGIHSGEASAAGERYVGFSVHRAARVGALGHGGQILVSSATRELVEDDLADGVTFRDLGAHRLKDVQRAERIAQVVTSGLQSKFPPLGPARRRNRRSRVVVAVTCLGLAAGATIGLVVAHGSSSTAASHAVAANGVGVVSSKTGRLTGSVSLGTAPTAIAASGDGVWVANSNANTVTRLDVHSTPTVAQTIDVDDGPSAITVGAGFVWVANTLSGTVSKIDPRANGGTVVHRIAVGNAPAGIAFGARGVWVANAADDTVVRIDPRTDRVGRPIPIERGADAVAAGFGAVWVASASAGSLSRVDPGTGTVTKTINVGNGAAGVAAGPDAVWVANSQDGTVSRVDPSSGIATTIEAGDSPSGIAVTDTNRVWVANDRAGTLSRIDPVKHAVVQTVRTGNRPEAVALAGARVIAAVQGAASSRAGGTLRVVRHRHVGGAANSLDPAVAYYPELLNMMNDGLVTYDRLGGNVTRLVPDLATDLPTPTDGGRTYTFQLRTGIRYSTGHLVRPADIRRGLERLLLRKGFYSQFLGDISGASACTRSHCDLSRGIAADAETNTVSIHLDRPDPDFLYKLAFPGADAVPNGTAAKPRLPLPATGPYMVKSYAVKGGNTRLAVTLVRNPYFHEWSPAAQPAGFPDRIVERFGGSDRDAARLVEEGSADVANVPLESVASTRRDYASQLHLNAQLSTSYVWLNTRRPPFDDVRARRALNYAVDRERLLSLAGAPGLGVVSCQLIPANVPGYRRYCPYTIDPRSDGRYTGRDLAAAQKLVKASVARTEIVTVMAAEADARAGAYVTSVLRELGYKARLKVFRSASAFFNAQDDPKKTIQAGLNGWTADYPGAADFLIPLIACSSVPPVGGNSGSFCNHRIDADIARARAVPANDPFEAARLWAKAEQEIVDAAPLVAYGSLPNSILVSRRVGNFKSSPIWSVLLDQLWVR